jgi:hypothetical protein
MFPECTFVAALHEAKTVLNKIEEEKTTLSYFYKKKIYGNSQLGGVRRKQVFGKEVCQQFLHVWALHGRRGGGAGKAAKVIQNQK